MSGESGARLSSARLGQAHWHEDDARRLTSDGGRPPAARCQPSNEQRTGQPRPPPPQFQVDARLAKGGRPDDVWHATSAARDGLDFEWALASSELDARGARA